MGPDYFKTFAHYNEWANKRLYQACFELSTDEYFQARPSFFGSIHRTLNHILAADLIWMSRFHNEPSPIQKLDVELHTSREDLWENRQRFDKEIKNFIEGLPDASFSGILTYRLITQPDQTRNSRMDFSLGHFFNHQTHHRGQVHGLLSQTKVSPPPLDFVYFLSELGL